MNLISIYKRPDIWIDLYALLSERDETVNISHQALPAWDDHVRFIESMPYEAWYFIMIEDEPIGACYLTKRDEIGVFIFKSEQGKGYGPKAIELLMNTHGPHRYRANINPRNERSAKTFSKLGFKLVQHTYELTA